MMKMTNWKIGILLPALVLALLYARMSIANDQSWPRKLTFEQGSMLIYQPQIEWFEGNSIEARAAISIKMAAAPIFAAVRFSAITDSAQNDAELTVRDIELMDLRFSEESLTRQEDLTRLVAEQLAAITLTLGNENRPHDATGLRSDAPRIILSTEPAMLVPIDGRPRLQRIEGSGAEPLEWVVNSAIPIIRQQQNFYLFGGGNLFYISDSVFGPWRRSDNVPDQVRAVVAKEVAAEQSPEENGTERIDPPPERIIVTTEPTELIVSDGDPSWSPVKGMDLLFMDNTDSNVFLELATGDHFLLLGGRWFRGALGQVDTNWQAVANDALPEAFADIAEDSPMQDVLTHVAGTPQAREALLENSLPQTKAVERDDASFDVDWDGEPQFETIETIYADDDNDEVQYAINTADSVFKVGQIYYACEQGVWYLSRSAFGPWSVAAEIPDIIYDIPPSNPHHRVTYVRIYDVTPEVVYVGYTPGYLGSYYYHGSIVYGTGWYYDPWYGSYYYPRRLTWGLSPYYDPWFGWNSGIAFLYSPFYYNVSRSSHHHRDFRSGRFGQEKHARYSRSNRRDRDNQSRPRDHQQHASSENWRDRDHQPGNRDRQQYASDENRRDGDRQSRQRDRQQVSSEKQRLVSNTAGTGRTFGKNPHRPSGRIARLQPVDSADGAEPKAGRHERSAAKVDAQSRRGVSGRRLLSSVDGQRRIKTRNPRASGGAASKVKASSLQQVTADTLQSYSRRAVQQSTAVKQNHAAVVRQPAPRPSVRASESTRSRSTSREDASEAANSRQQHRPRTHRSSSRMKRNRH